MYTVVRIKRRAVIHVILMLSMKSCEYVSIMLQICIVHTLCNDFHFAICRYLQNLKTLACDGNPFLTAPSSLKDMASLKEVCVNENQTTSLIMDGSDMTPALTILDSAEETAEHRKVPKDHMREGLESMSSYLKRLHLPCSAPAVDLTHMKLSMIPQELFTLTQLTLLDLKDNLVEVLPSSMYLLSKLKHLDLSSNQLVTLDSSIGFLTDLTWLSVAKNQINDIPEDVKYLQSLRFLDVHVNQLSTLLAVDHSLPMRCSHFEVESSSIPARQHVLEAILSSPGHKNLSGLAIITCLRDLEISYNKLRFLPDLRALRFLKRINLSHNILEALPEELCEVQTLVKLEAGDNRIRALPASVSKLTALSVLSLKNNSLESIPNEICRCFALKYLSLNSNKLSEVPRKITSLSHLSRLTIAANNISCLPVDMDRMNSLTHLEVSHNPLKALPPSLGALYEHLKVLLVQDCFELQDPPPTILSAGHEQIVNYLRKVWRGLCTMRLVLTGLSMGSLVCLPHFDLANLVEIRIDKNEIKYIPDIVCNFKQLVSLRFRENFVSIIPAETSKLTQLQELDMSKNKFRSMPHAVLQMTHLVRLRCGENPIPFTIKSEWIEENVPKFLKEYVRETTGRRVAGIFMNNNLGECFAAWQDLVRATLVSGVQEN
jgi:Leucine-rich repeat (LRR) protein